MLLGKCKVKQQLRLYELENLLYKTWQFFSSFYCKLCIIKMFSMICIVQWWKVILIIILLYYLYFTSFWELWAIAAHLDSLLKNYTAFIAIPYIAAFRAFKRVKDTCFGFDLIPGYKTAIQDFKSAYMKLGIPVSLKVHIMFEHIIQFCDKYDKVLGWFYILE